MRQGEVAAAPLGFGLPPTFRLVALGGGQGAARRRPDASLASAVAKWSGTLRGAGRPPGPVPRWRTESAITHGVDGGYRPAGRIVRVPASWGVAGSTHRAAWPGEPVGVVAGERRVARGVADPFGSFKTRTPGVTAGGSPWSLGLRRDGRVRRRVGGPAGPWQPATRAQYWRARGRPRSACR